VTRGEGSPGQRAECPGRGRHRGRCRDASALPPGAAAVRGATARPSPWRGWRGDLVAPRRDSARACLRRMVEIDPSYMPPGDLFNPELWATYQQVRPRDPGHRDRSSARHGNGARPRSPARENRGRATGRSAPVPAAHDPSVARFVSGGRLRREFCRGAHSPHGSRQRAVAAGFYEIEAEVVLPSGVARDLVTLSVERLSADTTPHVAPLASRRLPAGDHERRLSLRTLAGSGSGRHRCARARGHEQRACQRPSVPFQPL